MSNEYGAEKDDPINIFLEGLVKKDLKNDSEATDQRQSAGVEPQPERADVEIDDQPVQTTATQEVVQEVVGQVDIERLTSEQQLQVFKRLTNLDVPDIESIKNITETISKLPDYEKIIKLHPRLLEELKKKQDIMGYFPDENTFKAVQLAKNEIYKGKESALFNLFNSDVSSMGDMEVIALGAAIEKSPKISNPLRSAIKQIGLDPDEVLTNFDELSQDDKDDVAALADDYRRKLSQLKGSVQVPVTSSDIEKELLEMDSRSRDDFDQRMKSVAPVSMNIVNEIKELKVSDDFTFKLEMTPQEKKSYVDFLTQGIMSNQFDLSTDDGKRELHDALMTEIWVDNKDRIIKAYETHLKNKLESDFRAKYNNEKPLVNQEVKPTKSGEKSNPFVNLINEMISERI